MITFFVNKENGRTIIGEVITKPKVEGVIQVGVIITNYLEIRVRQTSQTNVEIMEAPYPQPIIPMLLNKIGLEKELRIDAENYYVYEEYELNDEILKWYKSIMAQKNSGIILTNKMPVGKPILNG